MVKGEAPAADPSPAATVEKAGDAASAAVPPEDQGVVKMEVPAADPSSAATVGRGGDAAPAAVPPAVQDEKPMSESVPQAKATLKKAAVVPQRAKGKKNGKIAKN